MKFKIPFFSKRNNSVKFVLPAYIDHSGSGAAILSGNGSDATSFSSLDLICSAFAGLQADVFDADTRQRIKNHPVEKALRRPSLDMTHFTLFYALADDYFRYGNSFLLAYRNSEDEVVSLYRLPAFRVNIYLDGMGRKIYQYNGNEYDSSTVIHVPSRFLFDGVRGYSIFTACKKAFNLTENMNSYTDKYFDNALGKRTVIDISKSLPDCTDEQLQQLRQKYANLYGGIGNTGRPIVKTAGVEFSTLDTGAADNRNSQLAENRKFQEQELLKVFGIPEAMLSCTGTIDIEGIYTLFTERAVKPLATQFEEALQNLFSLSEQNRFYIEYSYNSLIKTSLASRIDAYSKQFNIGLLSPNEMRAKENLPPVEAGSNHFVPANLAPLNDETVAAYMASSKVKIEQSENNNSSIGAGSDKR
jgi:HK97 family phage portal protein